MCQIIVFPLAVQRKLDVEMVAHDLAELSAAERARTWQSWAKKAKRTLVKRGVPADVAAAAVYDYGLAIRQKAKALGYVPSGLGRDRAS